MPEIKRAQIPPTSGVMRMAPFALRAEGDGEGDGRTLDGYAAVFDSVTLIDSWEGRFKEQIAPGSMRKSFRESPPVIQFDHGSHPLVGSIPIARLDSIAEETDAELAPRGGAHVIGTLHDNWLVQPVRDAIASQSIKGMSFRFSVIREEWHDAEGRKITKPEELQDLLFRSWYEDLPEDELLTRTLKELRVPELGPVVFPAYTETSVGVRSQVIDLSRLDDPQTRSLLAQAVLLADRLESESEGDAAPQSTDPERSAAEHPAEPADTPQGTDSPEPAAEHLSSSRLARRHELEEFRDVWRSITDTKGRYSR